MYGSTVMMEFKKSWKGLTLFLLIALLVAGGLPQFFTTFEDMSGPELEGAENVTLEKEDSFVLLSWEPRDEAVSYIVFEDNKTSMFMPKTVYQGVENNTEITYDTDEVLYYAVVGVNEDEDMIFIGMATTDEDEHPFQELVESGFYKGLTGGRNIAMYEIKGFLSLEVFSWWFLLVGLYIGYISVNTLTKDMEERRLDLIFSTAISRKQYLAEKFTSLAIYSLVLTLLSAVVMKASVNSIGYGAELSWVTSILSFIGSWAVLLVVSAVAFILSVYFKESRTAVGLILLFAFFQYAFWIVAGFSESYRWINDFTILGYWDYNSVLFDDIFNIWELSILLLLTGIAIAAAMMLFDREDIPT